MRPPFGPLRVKGQELMSLSLLSLFLLVLSTWSPSFADASSSSSSQSEGSSKSLKPERVLASDDTHIINSNSINNNDILEEIEEVENPSKSRSDNVKAGSPIVVAKASYYTEPSSREKIFAGTDYTCELLTSGAARCWGSTTYEKLARSDVLDVCSAPLYEVSSSAVVTSLAAAEHHLCALLDNGEAKCWGRNDYGQLGQGSTTNLGATSDEFGDSLAAIELGTGRTVKHLATRGFHVAALLDNDRVKNWGDGSSAQLGLGYSLNGSLGDESNEMGDFLPFVSLSDSGRYVTSLACGSDFTCALLDDGSVKCWGDNSKGALGLGLSNATIGALDVEMGDALPSVDLGSGRTAKAITAGRDFACAILDIDYVKCWGGNTYGQLGQEHTDNLGLLSTDMGDSLPTVKLGTGRTAVKLEAFSDHVCALLDDSSLKCWGLGTSGQLGQGAQANVGGTASSMGDNLDAIDLGTGLTVADFTVGATHTCALFTDGRMKCWGENVDGSLGLLASENEVVGKTSSEMGDALPFSGEHCLTTTTTTTMISTSPAPEASTTTPMATTTARATTTSAADEEATTTTTVFTTTVEAGPGSSTVEVTTATTTTTTETSTTTDDEVGMATVPFGTMAGTTTTVAAAGISSSTTEGDQLTTTEEEEVRTTTITPTTTTYTTTTTTITTTTTTTTTLLVVVIPPAGNEETTTTTSSSSSSSSSTSYSSTSRSSSSTTSSSSTSSSSSTTSSSSSSSSSTSSSSTSSSSSSSSTTSTTRRRRSNVTTTTTTRAEVLCELEQPIEDSYSHDCNGSATSCEVACSKGASGESETWVCDDDGFYAGLLPNCTLILSATVVLGEELSVTMLTVAIVTGVVATGVTAGLTWESNPKGSGSSTSSTSGQGSASSRSSGAGKSSRSRRSSGEDDDDGSTREASSAGNLFGNYVSKTPGSQQSCTLRRSGLERLLPEALTACLRRFGCLARARHVELELLDRSTAAEGASRGAAAGSGGPCCCRGGPEPFSCRLREQVDDPSMAERGPNSATAITAARYANDRTGFSFRALENGEIEIEGVGSFVREPPSRLQRYCKLLPAALLIITVFVALYAEEVLAAFVLGCSCLASLGVALLSLCPPATRAISYVERLPPKEVRAGFWSGCAWVLSVLPIAPAYLAGSLTSLLLPSALLVLSFLRAFASLGASELAALGLWLVRRLTLLLGLLAVANVPIVFVDFDDAFMLLCAAALTMLSAVPGLIGSFADGLTELDIQDLTVDGLVRSSVELTKEELETLESWIRGAPITALGRQALMGAVTALKKALLVLLFDELAAQLQEHWTKQYKEARGVLLEDLSKGSKSVTTDEEGNQVVDTDAVGTLQRAVEGTFAPAARTASVVLEEQTPKLLQLDRLLAVGEALLGSGGLRVLQVEARILKTQSQHSLKAAEQILDTVVVRDTRTKDTNNTLAIAVGVADSSNNNSNSNNNNNNNSDALSPPKLALADANSEASPRRALQGAPSALLGNEGAGRAVSRKFTGKSFASQDILPHDVSGISTRSVVPAGPHPDLASPQSTLTYASTGLERLREMLQDSQRTMCRLRSSLELGGLKALRGLADLQPAKEVLTEAWTESRSLLVQCETCISKTLPSQGKSLSRTASELRAHMARLLPALRRQNELLEVFETRLNGSDCGWAAWAKEALPGLSDLAEGAEVEDGGLMDALGEASLVVGIARLAYDVIVAATRVFDGAPSQLSDTVDSGRSLLVSLHEEAAHQAPKSPSSSRPDVPDIRGDQEEEGDGAEHLRWVTEGAGPLARPPLPPPVDSPTHSQCRSAPWSEASQGLPSSPPVSESPRTPPQEREQVPPARLVRTAPPTATVIAPPASSSRAAAATRRTASSTPQNPSLTSSRVVPTRRARTAPTGAARAGAARRSRTAASTTAKKANQAAFRAAAATLLAKTTTTIVGALVRRGEEDEEDEEEDLEEQLATFFEQQAMVAVSVLDAMNALAIPALLDILKEFAYEAAGIEADDEEEEEEEDEEEAGATDALDAGRAALEACEESLDSSARRGRDLSAVLAAAEEAEEAEQAEEAERREAKSSEEQEEQEEEDEEASRVVTLRAAETSGDVQEGDGISEIPLPSERRSLTLGEGTTSTRI